MILEKICLIQEEVCSRRSKSCSKNGSDFESNMGVSGKISIVLGVDTDLEEKLWL